VTDRVHTTVQPVQTAARDPDRDGVVVEPSPDELVPGHDPVLLRGECSDRQIESSVDFLGLRPRNSTLDCSGALHTAIVTRIASQDCDAV
jgi:hypothetical protein